MAKLRDAEKARAKWATELGKAGAHAISVEAQAGKSDDYEVVAWVESTAKLDLPKALAIGQGEGKKSVPLRVHRAESFEIEPAAGLAATRSKKG